MTTTLPDPDYRPEGDPIPADLTALTAAFAAGSDRIEALAALLVEAQRVASHLLAAHVERLPADEAELTLSRAQAALLLDRLPDVLDGAP